MSVQTSEVTIRTNPGANGASAVSQRPGDSAFTSQSVEGHSPTSNTGLHPDRLQQEEALVQSDPPDTEKTQPHNDIATPGMDNLFTPPLKEQGASMNKIQLQDHTFTSKQLKAVARAGLVDMGTISLPQSRLITNLARTAGAGDSPSAVPPHSPSVDRRNPSPALAQRLHVNDLRERLKKPPSSPQSYPQQQEPNQERSGKHVNRNPFL